MQTMVLSSERLVIVDFLYYFSATTLGTLTIILICCSLIKCLNLKFEESLPLSFTAVMIFLFIFGLLGRLKLGFYFVLSFSAFWLIFIIALFLRKNKIKKTRVYSKSLYTRFFL